MFDLAARISAFEVLGRFLSQYEEERMDEDLTRLNRYFLQEYHQAIQEAWIFNNWFTPENVKFALAQWSSALTLQNLEEWSYRYPADHFVNSGNKTVAIIMAGNIPLVGFHDFLAVLMSGHKVLVKPSADDQKLLPFIAQVLVAIDQRFAAYITFADGRIKNFDAVIATGSNNSARYFDYYFGKYPHIIRRNRTSAAVLTGEETDEDLKMLGEDVFRYFGLGCRNISKLFLPESFDLDRIFRAFYDFRDVVNNKKYGNNYDYNRAIYLMEKHRFLENGFVILKENSELHAPVGVLYYEYYQGEDALTEKLVKLQPELQCIARGTKSTGASIAFGETQKPRLWDYADKVDTLKFLRTV